MVSNVNLEAQSLTLGMDYTYLSENYTFAEENSRITTADFEKLKSSLKELMGDFKTTEVNIKPFGKEYNLYNDEFLINITSENNKNIKAGFWLNMYAKDNEIYADLRNLINKFSSHTHEACVIIQSWYATKSGLDYMTTTKDSESFDGLHNTYYPYLNIEEMFNQYVLSDDNILLLNGKPGTGKTKIVDSLLQYLLSSHIYGDKRKLVNQKEKELLLHNNKGFEPDARCDSDADETEAIVEEMFDLANDILVVYVKDEAILGTDEFWNKVKDVEPALIILDDLDYALLPRTQQIATGEDVNKNKFISNLLSFTDGIFEAGNKTKIIITTNRESEEIDTAVLRKGRTFDILNLRHLTKVEALKIWKEDYKLSVDEFNEKFTDDEVLASDLGAEAKLLIQLKELQVKRKPYVFEDGISIYNKTKQPSKIGY